MPTALRSAAPKLRTVLQTVITKASPRLRALLARAVERFPQVFGRLAPWLSAWTGRARTFFDSLPRKVVWTGVAAALVVVTSVVMAAVIAEPKQKVSTRCCCAARGVRRGGTRTGCCAGGLLPRTLELADSDRCALEVPEPKGTPRSRALAATSSLRRGGPAVCHGSRPPGAGKRLSRPERRAAAAAYAGRPAVVARSHVLEQPAPHRLRCVRKPRLLLLHS